jgi:hypothetical protein
MITDIDNYIASCYDCQRGQGGLNKKLGELQPLRADKLREWIFSDYIGPFHALLYILLIVDHYSGYSMLIPCWTNNAEDTMNGILSHWMPIFGWYIIK